MSEEVVLPIPNLKLAQNYFVLSSPHLSHLHDGARKELLEGIKADRTLHIHAVVLPPDLTVASRNGTLLQDSLVDGRATTRQDAA